jgi:hypothetical protein
MHLNLKKDTNSFGPKERYWRGHLVMDVNMLFRKFLVKPQDELGF